MPPKTYTFTPKRVNRHCSQCGLTIAPESNFCSSCGGVCLPDSQPKFYNSKLFAPLVVICSFIGFCAFCGLIGSLNKSVSNPSTSNSTSVSLVSTRKPSTAPIDTVKPAPNKSSIIKSSKTADIISENANLRAAANISSNVVGTIPSGETIGVLKQKGAWFYVESSLGKGWLHGNTIRLNQPESLNKSQTASIPVQPPARTISTPAPERKETVNPTGATAKCRDGSLSYSAHRRGTCSHHGGVAIWY